MSTDLPLQPADLPAPVAEAIRRAASRIALASHDVYYDAPYVTEEQAVEMITEELRPVLLGSPLPPIDKAAPERPKSAPDVTMFYTDVISLDDKAAGKPPTYAVHRFGRENRSPLPPPTHRHPAGPRGPDPAKGRAPERREEPLLYFNRP